MRFDRPYPQNLLYDLMLAQRCDSNLTDEEIDQEFNTVLSSLTSMYHVKKDTPARMQEVIRLYYQDNKSYVEIAKIFGVSKGRVGQIKGKTLRIMRGRLKDSRLCS